MLKQFFLAASLLFSTVAVAQNPAATSDSKDRSETAEMLNVAGKLVKYGYQTKAAMPLIQAAEIYNRLGVSNETEAKAFTKIDDPRQALEEISRYCSIAVVKVGKDGSWVKAGDSVHYIPVWPAATLDATGAGDTYAAGFLYGLAQELPVDVCGKIGSILAAKVVEIIGTKIDDGRWNDAVAEIRTLIATEGVR